MFLLFSFQGFSQRKKATKINCAPINTNGQIVDKDVERRLIELIINGDYEKLDKYITSLNIVLNYAINVNQESFLTLAIVTYFDSRSSFSDQNKFVKVTRLLLDKGADPYLSLCDKAEYFVDSWAKEPITAATLASKDQQLLNFITDGKWTDNIIYDRKMIETAITEKNFQLLTGYFKSSQKINISNLVYRIVHQGNLRELEKIEYIKTLKPQIENINEVFLDDWNKGEGSTPFTRAVELNQTQLVNFLIDSGAKLNIYDGRKYTPLGAAVDANNLELVKLLKSRGADLNQKSASKKFFPNTLISLQQMANSEEMKDYLFLNGIK